MNNRCASSECLIGWLLIKTISVTTNQDDHGSNDTHTHHLAKLVLKCISKNPNSF